MKKDNKNTQYYMYYSTVLKEPFKSVEELAEAEEAYYAKLKAKEDAATQKKADAQKVEDAFKALNAARKSYKEDIATLTKEYADSLDNLKKAYDLGVKDIKGKLATAEEAYSNALKEFTGKYDQYHMTLKDGDFETTISSTTERNSKAADDIIDIFKLLFK
jgi:chromosome segregation ATPase